MRVSPQNVIRQLLILALSLVASPGESLARGQTERGAFGGLPVRGLTSQTIGGREQGVRGPRVAFLVATPANQNKFLQRVSIDFVFAARDALSKESASFVLEIILFC